MKVKIATIGCCMIRDNFNSKFNPNYKMFFEVVDHQIQSAIPSLMSKPTKLVVNKSFIEKTSYIQNVALKDFDKSFLSNIKQQKPDYVLMDLYSDLKFGLLKTDEGNFVTDNYYFKDFYGVDKYDQLKIDDKFDEYFEVWKEAVNRLFSFIRDEVGAKIILIKGRFIDEFTDGTSLTEYRIQNKIPRQNYIEMNRVWDILESYIIDNFELEILDMTEKNYKLDRNHPWGPYYLHFENKFYNDFLNKLISITHENLETENLIQRIYPDDTLKLLNTKTVEVVLNSDKNIIKLARENKVIYNLYKNLLKNDYILYYHNNGISKLYKRKYIKELWKRKDLKQVGDIFYTLDVPKVRNVNTNNKLAVIFPPMGNQNICDNFLLTDRVFPKFFDDIGQHLVNNVYTMRIMDLNLSHGSHFLNTINNNTMEEDIIRAINNVRDSLHISNDDIVLYGVGRGGTGSLYYGAKLDLKTLAVNPIINLEAYNKEDKYFLQGLSKTDISNDINQNLKIASKRVKYIIGSENLPFNFSFIKKIEGLNVNIIDVNGEIINENADFVGNLVPEQLTLLNKMLMNS